MIVVVLISLLVLPFDAVQRSGIDFLWAGAYAIGISALTYWVYAGDKRRAEVGEWRVSSPESPRLQLAWRSSEHSPSSRLEC